MTLPLSVLFDSVINVFAIGLYMGDFVHLLNNSKANPFQGQPANCYFFCIWYLMAFNIVYRILFVWATHGNYDEYHELLLHCSPHGCRWSKSEWYTSRRGASSLQWKARSTTRWKLLLLTILQERDFSSLFGLPQNVCMKWSIELQVRMQDIHTGEDLTFVCQRWLSREEDDGDISREMPVVRNGIPALPR